MRAINKTETIVKKMWPNTLIPLNYGCDFFEVRTSGLVEVKTRALSDVQVKDMIFQQLSSLPAHLVIIGGPDVNYILTFRLEKIQTKDGSELVGFDVTPPKMRWLKAKKQSLSIPDSLFDGLTTLAKKRRTTRSRIIRLAIKEHLDKAKKAGEIE